MLLYIQWHGRLHNALVRWVVRNWRSILVLQFCGGPSEDWPYLLRFRSGDYTKYRFLFKFLFAFIVQD